MAETNQAIAKWIWTNSSSPNAVNQYAEFRLEIELKQLPQRASLRISVDTDFAAWINGQFAGCGQFTDFPDRRTFSSIDIASQLKSGRNAVAILVHYCGEDHFSYLPGPAGLWFEVEVDGKVVASSNERTISRTSPSYTATETVRIDVQRGFTFHFDATREDDWKSANYSCGPDWSPSKLSIDQGIPEPRPLEMLRIQPQPAVSIVAQGLFKHAESTGANVSELMQRDFLSARRSWDLFKGCGPNTAATPLPVKITPDKLQGADGVYVVIDLGREEVGFPIIELNTADGCSIDIGIGEHLDDLRVRSHIGGRNFASRYVARAGAQRFVHHVDRYAGRYIQLHFSNFQGEVELKNAGLLPVQYPVKFAGEFASADSLCNQIWNTSRRTLHLCMFEHYEDCPWREQGLYANDSRNQMLAGYYAFGEYDFARVSLELLARSTSEDGYQELCAPMKCPITIPSFTLIWFLAMNDYLLFSGDRRFIVSEMPRMKRMLATYLSTLKDGLLPCPMGKRYWHFYDWESGLDGTDENECRNFKNVESLRFDAPLNLFLILVLQAAAHMAKETGDEAYARQCAQQAEALRAAVHRGFWNESLGAYQTYVGGDKAVHAAELTQSLAILAGLGDAALHGRLRSKLMSSDSGWVGTTLSQSFYKFEALLIDPATGSFVRDRIIRDFSKMLFAGATSFWETLNGGWDFQHAGSLCHGWSGTPAYFYGAYALGIKPLTPGFAKVSVKPVLGMPGSAGVVPTPLGEIRVVLDGVRVAKVETPSGVELVGA